jgi:superfamily I DNA/RNA helicase
VDGWKYKSLIRTILTFPEVQSLAMQKRIPLRSPKLIDDLAGSVDLCLVNLSFSDAKIFEVVSESFNYDPSFETLVIKKAIKMGLNESLSDGVISFSDMISLPFCGKWPLEEVSEVFQKYPIIFLDEAQDTSPAQLRIVQESLEKSGQLVSIGDNFQSIFSFCGASNGTLDRITEDFEATEFSFPTCYRCPDVVLNMVKDWVPGIVGTGKEGSVNYLDSDPEVIGLISRATLEDDWIILCRTNTPLVALALSLLNLGIPFRFNRNNVESKIQGKLKHLESLSNSFDEILEVIEDQKKLVAENKNWAVYDILEAIQVIVGLRPELSSWAEIRSEVRLIFLENDSKIVLGSIHSFKGDEAKNVLVYRKDLLPFPRAETESELTQEENLRYVAYTRALENLYIHTPAD